MYIYTMEYYSSMKKKEILSLATTMVKLEGVIPSEKKQTDKCCMVSLICEM